jgi:hypothetical protein
MRPLPDFPLNDDAVRCARCKRIKQDDGTARWIADTAYACLACIDEVTFIGLDERLTSPSYVRWIERQLNAS